MVPILINKDVFEPSYNDLKFMIWNCNYVCTNLVRKHVSSLCWCPSAGRPAAQSCGGGPATPHTSDALRSKETVLYWYRTMCLLHCVSLCLFFSLALFFLKGHTHNPALAHLWFCISRGKHMSMEEMFWLWENFDEGDGNT